MGRYSEEVSGREQETSRRGSQLKGCTVYCGASDENVL